MPTKKVGISGKFGARCGAMTRKRWRMVVEKMKGKIKCPRCQTLGSVHRVSVGIWHCRKCEATFTGGAYYIQTPRGEQSFRIAGRKQRELEGIES